MLLRYAVFDVNFLVPTRFLMKIFRCNVFLNDAFHVGVRQRSQYLILHRILDIYLHISFMNKGMSIVQKMHV